MPRLSRLWPFLLVLLLLPVAAAPAQDSGGPLLPQQAAYDVTYYDLHVTVHPNDRSLDGTLTAYAVVQDPLDAFVLNLDWRLKVEAAWMANPPSERGAQRTAPPPMPPSPESQLTVTRKADSNQVWLELPAMAHPGDTLRVALRYRGTPRSAPRPPWNGGVTWARTPAGAPWIATSVQTEGADLWWPVKDHPSDEPDSMDIHVTVPASLVVASNGVLQRVDPSGPQRTYHWHVSNPINAYGVAINIAPYATVDTTYVSTGGEQMPVRFYALPSDSSRAQSALPHFLEQLRFLEETLGPYPFRDEKYGIAQTPFKGMEHQTIIAYGNEFRLNGGLGYDAGFDALHFHELAHEWYGNCVTVEDWKDFWIHEGVATYLEALYAESLRGTQGYRQVTSYFRQRLRPGRSIARAQPTSAQEMYGVNVYFKGALVLHTLRTVIGKEKTLELLRRFVNPTEQARMPSDGRPCRHVSTSEFVQLAEEVAGRQLDAFFHVYLYEDELPRIEMRRSGGGTVTLRWTQTGGAPFEIPVPVQVDGALRRVDMTGGQGTAEVDPDASVIVDPRRELLTAPSETARQ